MASSCTVSPSAVICGASVWCILHATCPTTRWCWIVSRDRFGIARPILRKSPSASRRRSFPRTQPFRMRCASICCTT
uniref:Putative secreted protein n=1 Tax=Anopheles marajoara TaxID=58244 RepID=A0A2M4CD23_9DIPT